MPPDPVLSRELKSLQEELATASRKRPVQPTDKQAETTAGTGTGTAGIGIPAGQPEETPAEHALSSQLRDLVDELTDFVDEAEENISTHPAMSVVAALLLGIAIGSLLARR